MRGFGGETTEREREKEREKRIKYFRTQCIHYFVTLLLLVKAVMIMLKVQSQGDPKLIQIKRSK